MNWILVFVAPVTMQSFVKIDHCDRRSDDRHTHRQTDRCKWFYNLSHAML